MLRKKFLISPAAALFFAAGTSALFSAGTTTSEDAPVIVDPAPVENAIYSTTQSMRVETRLTAFFLERAHIMRKKIAEMDMSELIKTDCSELDGAKSFFFQSDVDALTARFAPTLSDYIARGNLHAAFTIYKAFSERVNERLAWIDQRLQKPELFNLNRPDSIKINRKDENWPANEAEANELWEERLTLELVSQIFNQKDKDAEKSENNSVSATGETAAPAPSAEEIAGACEKLRTDYAMLRANIAREPWEIEEIFLNALCKLYDPHTSFFSKQTMEEFEIMMRNSLCGIGAVLTMEDGYCTVREIMPGSPAERSGKISPGDRIIAVSDDSDTQMTNIVNMRLNRIVRMLRGKEGVPVHLLVESGADHSRQVLTLVRDKVKLTEQLASAKIIDVPVNGETVPVGVIQLPSFYGKDRTAELSFSTTEDVKELLGKLKKSGVRAIVLDLRSNGGGYLNEAIDLTELFVGPGVPALQTKDSDGRISTLRTSGALGVVKNVVLSSRPEWTGPVVILVSKLSASASEIVAGALQDNRRAIVVGDPNTHGKGSVQEVIPFNQYDSEQDASIKLTRSKWYTPSGNSIQIKGISADIPAPSVFSVLPVGEGDLDHPLPWDSIPSALGKTEIPDWAVAPISPELIAQLAENSRRRQTELPEFLTNSRVVSWRAEREKDKSYPLGIEARTAMKDEDNAFADWVKKEYVKLAETSAFNQTDVKLDSALEQEKNAEDTSKSLLSTKIGSLSGLPAKTGSEDEEWPDFDVLMRESARIAADWVALIDKNSAAKNPAAPAK